MGVELSSKKLAIFIKTYMSIIRRYCSVLSLERRTILPDFWKNCYQIIINNCDDGITIEFRRRIGKKKDSIKVSRKKSINSVYPQFTGVSPRFPIDGKTGIGIANLAIATESCMPYLDPNGTLLKIPDGAGIVSVKDGGDVMFMDFAFFFVDKKQGRPKQFTFKELWILFY